MQHSMKLDRASIAGPEGLGQCVTRPLPPGQSLVVIGSLAAITWLPAVLACMLWAGR